ncbi:hypothetical protein BDN72DRAFT_924140 [Pluteus cervinus]|uniref:Uncharacterized protein n=1 Tax=Pluteus cervinus TaxID=181527 RepID=A0ACD3AHB4_9AGAR|nr:hypothetical protein BDN72DRAFT_924140 [Pluteus cervinus]
MVKNKKNKSGSSAKKTRARAKRAGAGHTTGSASTVQLPTNSKPSHSPPGNEAELSCNIPGYDWEEREVSPQSATSVFDRIDERDVFLGVRVPYFEKNAGYFFFYYTAQTHDESKSKPTNQCTVPKLEMLKPVNIWYGYRVTTCSYPHQRYALSTADPPCVIALRSFVLGAARQILALSPRWPPQQLSISVCTNRSLAVCLIGNCR